jgi:hypothetical protein
MFKFSRPEVAFADLEGAVQAYTENPKAKNPAPLVDRYFDRQGKITEWSSESSETARALLEIGNTRVIKLLEASEGPRAQALEALTRKPPYFYPAHLRVLDWLVCGRIESQRSSDPIFRERIVADTLEQVERYDPLKLSLKGHKLYINTLVMALARHGKTPDPRTPPGERGLRRLVSGVSNLGHR